jgi:DNA-3-methyladenine glycosylase I
MRDKLFRCSWAKGELYESYHDHEWGRPVHDDRVHFEFLLLEAAQAGLSWITILKKREAYRHALAGFDPEKVARFSDDDLELLLRNPALVRNRLKIYAVRSNAKAFLAIQKKFGSFDSYVWRFVKDTVIDTPRAKIEDLPSRTDESDRLSEDLKRVGFKFVGSKIIYAYMQACGLVNDHLATCHVRSQRLIAKKL